MLYSIYRNLTYLTAPFLGRLIHKRLDIGKEDPNRYQERFGVTARNRPSGKVLWIHGASVGESLSALPLLNTLKARLPDWNFMMTTGTVTSANILAQRLPSWAIHQFIPWDHPVWVKKFVDHWQPDAVVWLESELWPNILNEIKERDIPTALINARMRPKSYDKWRKFPGFAKQMMSTFTFVLTGAREFVALFKNLGAQNVYYIGSMKFGAQALPVPQDALQHLKKQIGDRTCIGFLSTHPTEEALAADVHAELKKEFPDLLTIIAPRKVTRGKEIVIELKEKNISVALRSANEAITPQTDIYVADTIGEMGLWYTLCPLAVIGGSFIHFGGQNPLEATHFGSAVLYGNSMFNFIDLCKAMQDAKASIEVPSRDALPGTIRDLLTNKEKLSAMQDASRALANQNVSVIDDYAEEIITRLVKR